jgi:hypothetical protein
MVGKAVELHKLLLWEVVAWSEEELVEVHKLEAVEELEVCILILEGRAVELRKLLLWEVVTGVEELEVHIPILEVKVVVGAVVHTQLETERHPCDLFSCLGD